MHRYYTIRPLTGLLAALALTLGLAACSGDDKNAMGPDAAPMPLDEITVTFQSLKAVLDCDGPDNPGDFHYSLNVVTMGADGNFYAATKVGERSATLSNGVTRVAPFSVKVTVPAFQFSEFQVRLRVREDDGANDDFVRTAIIRHVFQDQNQAWTGGWDESTRSGSHTWSLKLRDQETNWIGGITEEGCHFEMKYTLSAIRVF